MISVQVATEATSTLVEAFARLLPQLSPDARPPGRAALEEIIASPTTTLLVALDGDSGDVVGTLTLVVFRVPTGMRAWIEDVVVDERARGRGIGESLAREAIRLAASSGAEAVDLTSRPSRAAANRLYRRLGFRLRATNVFRYTS